MRYFDAKGAHPRVRMLAELRAESEAIAKYLARLNDVRPTRMERFRRWWRRTTFGMFA
jgi:acetyl-CoA carboxylase alpha subunit